jgi:hypothetical protein
VPPAFVYGAGPGKNTGHSQSVQSSVAVVALRNFDPGDGMAVAVRRTAIELARTSIVAIAVNELAPFDAPANVGHVGLPCYNSASPHTN